MNGVLEREYYPREAKALLESGVGAQLIDVRQPDEYQEARIHGATLIPLAALPARLHELDRDRPVLFYCASGGRSAHALMFAETQGYQAAHIVGGIGAWAEEGLPYEG